MTRSRRRLTPRSRRRGRRTSIGDSGTSRGRKSRWPCCTSRHQEHPPSSAVRRGQPDAGRRRTRRWFPPAGRPGTEGRTGRVRPADRQPTPAQSLRPSGPRRQAAGRNASAPPTAMPCLSVLTLAARPHSTVFHCMAPLCRASRSPEPTTSSSAPAAPTCRKPTESRSSVSSDLVDNPPPTRLPGRSQTAAPEFRPDDIGRGCQRSSGARRLAGGCRLATPGRAESGPHRRSCAGRHRADIGASGYPARG